jgi:hypothetical protein
MRGDVPVSRGEIMAGGWVAADRLRGCEEIHVYLPDRFIVSDVRQVIDAIRRLCRDADLPAQLRVRRVYRGVVGDHARAMCVTAACRPSSIATADAPFVVGPETRRQGRAILVVTGRALQQRACEACVDASERSESPKCDE